jgi:hypothetical protein
MEDDVFGFSLFVWLGVLFYDRERQREKRDQAKRVNSVWGTPTPLILRAESRSRPQNAMLMRSIKFQMNVHCESHQLDAKRSKAGEKQVIGSANHREKLVTQCIHHPSSQNGTFNLYFGNYLAILTTAIPKKVPQIILRERIPVSPANHYLYVVPPVRDCYPFWTRGQVPGFWVGFWVL